MKKFNKDEIPTIWNKEELLNWCQMYLERVDVTAEVLSDLISKAHNEGIKYEQFHHDDLEGMGLLNGKCGAWTS